METGRALVLAESVEALRESLGLSISIAFWDALLERYLAPARDSLGDDYDAVRAEGRALVFDDDRRKGPLSRAASVRLTPLLFNPTCEGAPTRD